MLTDIVASSGSASEPLRITATDIVYSYLRFTSTVTYNVTLMFDPHHGPNTESIRVTLADQSALTNALRSAGVPGATVSEVSPVDLSIVTTELPAEFMLTLHMDACTLDAQHKNVCIAPSIQNGAIQHMFTAELSALLQVSIDRLSISVTQVRDGKSGEEVSVLITISSSTGFPGEPTTSAALLLLNHYLETFESPLYRSQSWYSLASRGLRAQLEATVAEAARDVQLSNHTSYNVTLSRNNETRNSSSSWVPNAIGSATALEDDGASWSETPIDCRNFDSPGCPGNPVDLGTVEPEPDLPETSTSLRREDSSSNVFHLIIAAYGACAIVAAGFWLHRCRRKRARVMSSYNSPVHDDETHTDRKPESSNRLPTERGIIDSNDLKLIDPKRWRRRPPTRDPSDTEVSSVASDGRSEETFDSADEQRWELAPEEKVVPGSRVQVTKEGSKQLGRIGTRCLNDGCNWNVFTTYPDVLLGVALV
jgi:hypothetical protein